MLLSVDFPDLSLGPVRAVSARAERYRGMRAVSTTGLLLHGRSVHSLGMPRALGVVFLDDCGLVLKAIQLRPGRLAWHRHARFVLETPVEWGLPAVGDRGVAYAHVDVRTADLVCDPDRESG